MTRYLDASFSASGLTVYTQVLDVHPLLLILVNASNIGTTLILF